MEDNVVLTARGISMTFPGVKALENVDFTLRKGEIHALMGENGAGKSTLIKCLTGINDFEAGEIHVDGIEGPVKNHSTRDAQNVGISTVYQEVNLCPNLSVAENLFIGREPMTKYHTIDRKACNLRSQKIMDELGISVDVTSNLENYSLAIQQMVAIARAVDMDCKVLILDEPTSSLDDEEVEKLFVLMRRLRDKGVGIIFVTHFLEQVYAVCDRITVLRDGHFVGEYLIEDLPRVKLVAAMMGKNLDDLEEIGKENVRDISKNPIEISARGLSHTGTVKPFDLDIRKGEVIGVTGLLGSGRSELARAIYGADKASTGTLKVDGKEVKISQPIDAMNLGMGMLPDDRKAEGIIGDLSVRENMILALQARKGMFKPLSRAKQEEIVDQYIDLLQIKTANKETLVKQLSGGNQQKVILGKWLAADSKLIIFDEPTRGIDVGAKYEIYKLINDLVESGRSILMISSEMEELIGMSDRIIVLAEGEMTGELQKEEFNSDTIMSYASGVIDMKEAMK